MSIITCNFNTIVENKVKIINYEVVLIEALLQDIYFCYTFLVKSPESATETFGDSTQV